MQSPITPEGANLAEHACASCKARKRKCDKKLPKCSSCLKKALRCDYSKLTPDTTHVLSSWPYNAVTGNDWPAEQHIDVPTLTFLDSRVLEHGQLDIPRRTVPIPTQIAELVGDIAAVCTTAAEFFQTIHPWMPFISKKRFYGQHLKQVLHSHEDITLLFLCMKLITQIPPSDPRCTLYSCAKHFYLEVEGSGISTIQVLQAGILISLYEIGNAIYPAAFLSLGTCARFASVLGINRGGLVQTSKVTTLVELEERRRVWWAIVILDRYVNVGCPGRPLAAEDPKLHDLLPTNDVAWDQGTVLSEDSFTLGSPLNDHMSKFALLCQASRLLGLVLSHITCDKMINQEQREANEIQLSRTIFAMINASSELESPDYDQIAFCYCALMALHEPGTSPHEKDEIRRQRATAAMDEISERMISSLEKKIPYLVANRDKIPPWGLHLAYRSYVIYMQKRQRDSEMDVSETLRLLKKLLSIIDGRWKAAGAYLKIIEAREAMSLD